MKLLLVASLFVLTACSNDPSALTGALGGAKTKGKPLTQMENDQATQGMPKPGATPTLSPGG
jgi:hypothetical protein